MTGDQTDKARLTPKINSAMISQRRSMNGVALSAMCDGDNEAIVARRCGDDSNAARVKPNADGR